MLVKQFWHKQRSSNHHVPHQKWHFYTFPGIPPALTKADDNPWEVFRKISELWDQMGVKTYVYQGGITIHEKSMGISGS